MELKHHMDNEHAWTGSVLIVPSGIETPMKHTGKMCSGVLIVPSGIETSELIQLYSLRQSINCT